MQKVMKSTKKDISLILCIIYFSYLIFKIFIQKEIIMTNNSILKTIYFFKIDKLLFCIPILYYFIKNNKVNEYFKTNRKLNIGDFITYFALIFWIDILLNFLISFIGNIEEKKLIIHRPIYIEIIYAIFIAPILEEIIFRGVLMANLKKYGIKTAIIVSSLFFGLSHYNVYKYSIKYSILIHLLINIVARIPEIIFILKKEKNIFFLGMISILLFIFCLVFFIIGLKKRNYRDVFSVFKLNEEDRKNIVIFLKNNILYILVIFIIVFSNLLFNYRLF